MIENYLKESHMNNLINYKKLKNVRKCTILMLLMCILAVFPSHSGRYQSFRAPHALKMSKLQQTPKAKSSKFLTGLAAGSLLFSQKGNFHSVAYNEDYELSNDDELYIEYERNKQLLDKGKLSKEKK